LKPADLSLYLHIPFCQTRCTYCAFNTYTNAEDQIARYVAAMCHELRLLGRVTTQPLHTIYFGGGTPSMLTPDQVRMILDTCRDVFEVRPNTEITLEANPRTIRDGYFDALRAAGVNRLSLGMQSTHSSELKLFARGHDVNAVADSMQMARQAGFDSVSLDLIFGIPNQTLEMWHESVEVALALEPDHLSMYALILESGTALTKQIEGGTLPNPDDDLAADMYDLADEMAHAAGLTQYEISNWAREGKECIHNLQYWRNLPYLGVGAGAHGYAANTRYEVVRPIPRYITLAESQQVPQPYPLTATVERCETITTAGAMAEHMLTGLRLIHEGVSVSGFAERFGVPIESIYGEPLERLTSYGLLTRQGDEIRLTPRARLLSNRVFMEFME
jgi:oxygen-independent coproporphyrinogen-3 oxidase